MPPQNGVPHRFVALKRYHSGAVHVMCITWETLPEVTVFNGSAADVIVLPQLTR